MKKNTVFFFAVLLTATVFYACDKAADLLKFNHSFTKSFPIPGTVPTSGVQEVATPLINTGIDSLLKAHNVSLGLINEMKITALTLTAKEFGGTTNVPDSVFKNFESIEVLMDAGSLGKKSVATAAAIPDLGKEIKFTIPDQNLKDYLTQNSIGLSLKINTAKGYSKIIKAEIKMDYSISGKL